MRHKVEVKVDENILIAEDADEYVQIEMKWIRKPRFVERLADIQ